MADFTQELIALLQYLLPGLLAAWIFYGLTSHPLPSQFERVVQALVLTLLIQILVALEIFVAQHFDGFAAINVDVSNFDIVASTLTALFVGFVFSWAANKDIFHQFARWIGITSETSYPSEWFGAFLKNVTYVVLHLHDERRVYGWPIEWPSDPEQGHFLLEQVSWLDGTKETPLTGVKSILVNAKDVKWVEFMEKTWEKENGKKGTESASSAAAASAGK